MWWPALGAVVVGVIGVLRAAHARRRLRQHRRTCSPAAIVGRALLVLVVLKFISWAVYLGSGTSGGTLAPLFTIGGGIGAWLGDAVRRARAVARRRCARRGARRHGGDVRRRLARAAHLGRLRLRDHAPADRPAAAARRAARAAYLVALLINRHSIMTREARAPRCQPAHRVRGRLPGAGAGARCGHARRRDTPRERHDRAGARVDRDAAARSRRTRASPWSSERWRRPGRAHAARSPGSRVRMRRKPCCRRCARPPVVVYDDNTLRDAADQMVTESVGRLPVVEREAPHRLIGIISRSDLLTAHAPRLSAASQVQAGRPLSSWAMRR